jgi:hypothetical protein
MLEFQRIWSAFQADYSTIKALKSQQFRGFSVTYVLECLGKKAFWSSLELQKRTPFKTILIFHYIHQKRENSRKFTSVAQTTPILTDIFIMLDFVSEARQSMLDSIEVVVNGLPALNFIR